MPRPGRASPRATRTNPPSADATRFATLIDTAELGRHLDDPALVVVDVRHDLAHPNRFGVDAYAIIQAAFDGSQR